MESAFSPEQVFLPALKQLRRKAESQETKLI
jgi:hypothetical protein